MPYPIDVCMVSWHRPELTELTIRTIAKNTLNRSNYRLLVCDNDSPLEMKDMLGAFQDEGLIDELFLANRNLGLEDARQLLLEKVESDHFVCADNDCLPMRPKDGLDWLSALVSLIERHPDYAAISARTQVMIGTGNIFEDREGEELVDFPHPGGSLRIMRTEAVREVGGWDRDEPGRGSEERYICGKLREAGWKTAFATKVHCLHLFGDQNSDRWGYPKDWTPEKSGHSDIWHPAFVGDDPEIVREYTGD